MFIVWPIARIWNTWLADLWRLLWDWSLTLPPAGTVLRLRSYSLQRAISHLHREITLCGQISGTTQRCMKGE